MRILILSDLHLEFGCTYAVPPGVEYDAVILAGDISSPGVAAVQWAASRESFGGRPVVLVVGNHEYYGTEMSAQIAAMRRAAEGTTVHLLDRNSVEIDGVRFLGVTLWTDFSLPVENDAEPVSDHAESDIARALKAANARLNDFRMIEKLGQVVRLHRERSVRRLLTAEDTLAKHWVDRDWLRRELELGYHGPTVVVSHHAPHRRSVSAQYRDDWLTPAFVSDLPVSFFGGAPMGSAGREHLAGGPTLWVHGHTHDSFDYQVGACRVVANPRGYGLSKAGAFENLGFDPAMVVEL